MVGSARLNRWAIRGGRATAWYSGPVIVFENPPSTNNTLNFPFPIFARGHGVFGPSTMKVA